MAETAEPLYSGGRILIVDDEAPVRRLLKTVLGAGLVIEEAGTGEDAVEIAKRFAPDVVLLDLNLPGMSGHDVLSWIRGNPQTRLLPVVMITGVTDRADKLRAVREGVTDFITKPFVAEELVPRVRALVRLKQFTDALEDAEEVLIALAKTIDARDPYTQRHSERVSYYGGLLGERIGLKGPDLLAVRRGGLLHDIGKIAIPDAVLLKPGALTPDERATIQRHPAVGRDLLKNLKTLSWANPVVYHHHERLDGSGYPDGLSGDAIPLTARVTTIADIYDALTTARVYRKALTRGEAMEIMGREAEKGWWDRRLLDEFQGVLESVPEENVDTAAAETP